MSSTKLDVQGHRGCRGLYPENTIVGFIHAIDLGVNTLELDVVVSKDKKVIVSHEPFLNHEICSDLSGNRIPEKIEKKFNIYKLLAEELQQYDCGLLKHPRFPEQQNITAHKPSLDEMMQACESHVAQSGRPEIYYNIEIKRTVHGDDIFHPDFQEFADLVMEVIQTRQLVERTTVQCFDLQVLQYLHEHYPQQAQVLLIDNKLSIEENISTLGHQPSVYSPDFRLVKTSTIDYCKSNNIRLIPWTVNDPEKMLELIELGVDGIITDYPNVLLELIPQIS